MFFEQHNLPRCKKCIYDKFLAQSKSHHEKADKYMGPSSLSQNQMQLIAQSFGIKPMELNAHTTDKAIMSKANDRIDQVENFYKQSLK